MLTLIIIAILLYAFYSGYKNGVIMQAIRMIGYGITYMIAINYYEPLSQWVEFFIPFPAIQIDSNLVLYNEAQSFMIDKAFYYALTFLIITLIGWLISNILSVLFTKVIYYDVFKWANRFLGGLLNLLVVYTIVFLALYIFSLLPIEFIQQQFVDNPLAFWIVDSTPVLADYAQKIWLSTR